MDHVGVGVGIWVVRDGRVLLGRRRGSHGAGQWAPPGGHIERWEAIQQTVTREVAEETGAQVAGVRVVGLTEDMFLDEGKHYVTIWVTCRHESGEVANREPDRCDGWEWFDPDDLPDDQFLTVRNFMADPAMVGALWAATWGTEVG